MKSTGWIESKMTSKILTLLTVPLSFIHLQAGLMYSSGRLSKLGKSHNKKCSKEMITLEICFYHLKLPMKAALKTTLLWC